MATSVRSSTERTLVVGRGVSMLVPGVPVPQAELNAGRNGQLYYPNAKTLYPWRQAVAWAGKQAMLDARRTAPFEGVPIELEVTFYLTPPKRLTRGLPFVRPDLQHLVRAIEDALSGIAYKDDSQVTDCTSRKRYAAPDGRPCAVINVRPIGGAS